MENSIQPQEQDKTNWFNKHKVITGFSIVAVILFGIIVAKGSSSNNTNRKSATAQTDQANNQSQPTTKPTTVVQLSSVQKKQIKAILTKDVTHFEKLWQDGQAALGATQYDSASDGITALNDPNSLAAKFSAYKKSENPVNDNSFIHAMNQADNYYAQNNLSDQPLHTWSDDMEQLSIDMGTWVQDATGWQVKSVSTDKLTSDANTVTKDFSIVQQDIQAIK